MPAEVDPGAPIPGVVPPIVPPMGEPPIGELPICEPPIEDPPKLEPEPKLDPEPKLEPEPSPDPVCPPIENVPLFDPGVVDPAVPGVLPDIPGPPESPLTGTPFASFVTFVPASGAYMPPAMFPIATAAIAPFAPAVRGCPKKPSGRTCACP